MSQHALSSAAVLSAPRPPGQAARSLSPEGIGDVVDAGRRSRYAHLAEGRLPTVGLLAGAARGAAGALNRTGLWPARRGHWQRLPRAARSHVGGALRVTVVVLEPNGFVSGPAPRSARSHGMEVLYPVRGRAHLISSAPDGRMRSASELSPDRVRVVGSGEAHRSHLVNTGDELAVVVRVTA